MVGENMKKLFLIVIGVILFTGCKSKNVMECSFESDDGETSIVASYIVKYKGDKVTKVNSVEKITSSNPDFIDYQKESIRSYYEPFSLVDNYNYELKFDDENITITFDVDYEHIDFDQLLMIEPGYSDLMVEDYIDIDQLKISYEDENLICKK